MIKIIKQIEKGKRRFSRRDQNSFDSPRKDLPITKQNLTPLIECFKEK